MSARDRFSWHRHPPRRSCAVFPALNKGAQPRVAVLLESLPALIHYVGLYGEVSSVSAFHFEVRKEAGPMSRPRARCKGSRCSSSRCSRRKARGRRRSRWSSTRPIDFSKYKTFAIREGQLNSGNPALNSPLVKKQIEADIQNDLTAKGLHPGDERRVRSQRALHVRRRAQNRDRGLSRWLVWTRHALRPGAVCRGNAGHRSARSRRRARSSGAPSPPRKKATPPRFRESWTTWSKNPSTNIRRRRSS